MFLNAIAFPLCNAMDILWNRNMISCAQIGGSLPVLRRLVFCGSVCRRRCCCRCVGDVRVGVGVRDGDVPRHWLAPCIIIIILIIIIIIIIIILIIIINIIIIIIIIIFMEIERKQKTRNSLISSVTVAS